MFYPSKSEIRLSSKTLIDRIIKEVKRSAKMNQCRKTSTVMSWLKKIGKKKTSSFIKFDIVVIYSSKTEKLLDNSIIFAKHHTTISDYETNIFNNSKKAVLFDSNDILINVNLLVYIY